MTKTPGETAPRAAAPVAVPSIEEFADAIMAIAHHLELRGSSSREIVPLTGSEVAVIRDVYRHPRTTPSKIAASTGMQRSNISTAIKLLEARGMLRRESPSGDARSVELVATELAAENVHRIRAWWVERLHGGSESALSESVAASAAIIALADSLRG